VIFIEINVDKIINAFTKIFCKRCKRLSHLWLARRSHKSRMQLNLQALHAWTTYTNMEINYTETKEVISGLLGVLVFIS